MDTIILQALRDKNKFRQLRAAVPDAMVGQETVALLNWFGAYWNAYPEHNTVQVPALLSLFHTRAASASPEQIAIMTALISRLNESVDADAVKGITSQLYERDFAGRAAAILNKYDAGEEVDVTFELNRMASENMRRLSASTPASYIDDAIEDILADYSTDRGLKLPTQLLRNHVGGLLGGDTVLVSARVDKGKTSLVAAALVEFAPQLEALGWSGRPMLWLNNEGSGKRILPRIYQAALKKTFTEICALSNAGELRGLYSQAVSGQQIRVKDMHGANLAEVERVIEEMHPCVVVFDMLANFRVPSAGGGSKSDTIETLGQEVREMAVRHDFVALETAQVSIEGDDQLYPSYGAIKDSKTALQGAVDVMLMMGALNSPMMDTVRGFSTPKNKRHMAGKPSYAQGQIFFDKERCFFSDGEGTTS